VGGLELLLGQHDGVAVVQRAEAGLDPAKSAGLEISAKPHKPSLNDAIPAKYKRWRKPGTPDSNK